MRKKDFRYSRQEKILGSSSLKQLSSARVAIVGLGGTGSFTAALLVRAGVGQLSVFDRDVVEEHNLPRQNLYSEEDVGKSKALCAAVALKKMNSSCKLSAFHEQINCNNAAALLGGAEVVFDCSDNLDTRVALNRACFDLQIPWVFSSALGWRAMVSTIIPRKTACFECWGSKGARIACADAGVVSPAVSLAAAVQVSEGLKLILNTRPAYANKLFFADLEKNIFSVAALSKNKNCSCAKA